MNQLVRFLYHSLFLADKMPFSSDKMHSIHRFLFWKCQTALSQVCIFITHFRSIFTEYFYYHPTHQVIFNDCLQQNLIVNISFLCKKIKPFQTIIRCYVIPKYKVRFLIFYYCLIAYFYKIRYNKLSFFHNESITRVS